MSVGDNLVDYAAAVIEFCRDIPVALPAETNQAGVRL